jgi:hypothetical protein
MPVTVSAGAADDGAIAANVGSLAHGARDVRSRRQLGHEGFDLLPAPTARLREDGLVVLRREVATQQPHGGEGQLSRGEELEDHRETPARPGAFNAVAGRIFR